MAFIIGGVEPKVEPKKEKEIPSKAENVEVAPQEPSVEPVAQKPKKVSRKRKSANGKA